MRLTRSFKKTVAQRAARDAAFREALLRESARPKDIVEVRHLGGHRLYLRFEDGAAGEVDLAPVLQFTGVFAPLSDPAYFGKVRVDPDAGSIVWPNGADLCPDVLRHRVTGEALPEQTDPARRTG